MPTLRFVVGLALLAGATHSLAATMFCCQDPGTNRRVCADGLPEQCRGRPYKLIDGAGNVIKEVGPPLTAEQKAQAEIDAKRKKEEEAVLREQRRKDQALLNTYSDLADIDRTRARAENEIMDAVKAAEGKIAAARKQRRKYENEAEFYKKKTLPPEVDKGLRDAESEIRSQNELLESKKRDLEAIRTKYDDDKKRYQELTGPRSAPIRSVPPQGTGTELRPR